MGNYTYIPPFYNMELGGNYEATHGFDGNGGHGLEGVAWWRLKQWMWQLQGGALVASRAELRTSRNMIDDLDHTFLR